MRPALAPVKTREGEAAAQGSSGVDVDAERGKCLGSRGSEVVRFGATRRGRKPVQGFESVVEGDSDGSGDVVVAGSGGSQAARSVWDKGVARCAGENAQGFEGIANGGAFETVITMLALGRDFHEVLLIQSMEVDTGGRWSYRGNHGQFGAGAGAAVDEAVEHACTRRFADGGGDSGDGNVVVCLYIHTLMVSEVLMSGNWQTDSGGHEEAETGADQSARSDVHDRGECEFCVWVSQTARVGRQLVERGDFEDNTFGGNFEDKDDNHLFHPLPDRSVPA